jgi:hypothetical protein
VFSEFTLFSLFMKGFRMKLSAEQTAVVENVKQVIRDNCATVSDAKLVDVVKEKTSVEFTRLQLSQLRQEMGLRKTRGRNSKLVV